MPECRLSVLGLCSSGMEQGTAGVGKSSLCSRFVSPGVDDWSVLGNDHSHWIDQADFQEAEIGGDHFLYFGCGRRDFYLMHHGGGGGGGSQVKSNGNGLSIHVVEHTTFVDSFTGKPFAGAESYEQRSTRQFVKPKEANKVVYSCRSHLGELTRAKSTQGTSFPKEYFSKNVRGRDGGGAGVQAYLYVLDPTATRAQRKHQWQMWEKCWANIPKNKREASVAIMISKCDVFSQSEDAPELSKRLNIVEFFSGEKSPGKFRDDPSRIGFRYGKISIPAFFVSSAECCGVDMPFIYVAHHALSLRGQPMGPIPWLNAVQMRAEQKRATLAAGDAFMARHVKRHTQTWTSSSAIFSYTTMDMCRVVNGVEECKALFRARLIALITAHAKEPVVLRDPDSEGQYGAVETTGEMEIKKTFRQLLTEMIQEHPDFEGFSGRSKSEREDGKVLSRNIGRLLEESRKHSVYRERQSPMPVPSATMAEAASEGLPVLAIEEFFGSILNRLSQSDLSQPDSTEELQQSDERIREAASILQCSPDVGDENPTSCSGSSGPAKGLAAAGPRSHLYVDYPGEESAHSAQESEDWQGGNSPDAYPYKEYVHSESWMGKMDCTDKLYSPPPLLMSSSQPHTTVSDATRLSQTPSGYLLPLPAKSPTTSTSMSSSCPSSTMFLASTPPAARHGSNSSTMRELVCPLAVSSPSAPGQMLTPDNTGLRLPKHESCDVKDSTVPADSEDDEDDALDYHKIDEYTSGTLPHPAGHEESSLSNRKTQHCVVSGLTDHDPYRDERYVMQPSPYAQFAIGKAASDCAASVSGAVDNPDGRSVPLRPYAQATLPHVARSAPTSSSPKSSYQNHTYQCQSGQGPKPFSEASMNSLPRQRPTPFNEASTNSLPRRWQAPSPRSSDDRTSVADKPEMDKMNTLPRTCKADKVGSHSASPEALRPRPNPPVPPSKPKKRMEAAISPRLPTHSRLPGGSRTPVLLHRAHS
eukprot:scpid27274/ scgid0779/ Rho GTPase-activating protein 190; Rho GTPase-activating protein of 190 kDa